MTDKERIGEVLKYLDISKNKLGISIGLRNGMRFQNIQSGRSKITDKLASDIIDIYPQFSYEWLRNGEGKMLKWDGNLPDIPDYTQRYIAMLEKGNQYLNERCIKLEKKMDEMNVQHTSFLQTLTEEVKRSCINSETIISLILELSSLRIMKRQRH